MSTELISILVLALIFVIATFVPINIGALAFVAAFVLGSTALGLSADEILKGFPAGLAVTLIGITYLFAIAQNNGTIDWLVGLAVRAVQGRLVVIPWIMFAVSGALTAAGAVSPAAVAIIAPIALGFAYRYRISPLLMGLMVIHGAQAGGFSPISIYGSITNKIVSDSQLPSSPATLFLTSLLFNLAIAVIAFLLLGGPALLRRRAGDPDADALAVAAPATTPATSSAHGAGLHPHPDQSAQTVSTGVRGAAVVGAATEQDSPEHTVATP
jgi:hypothetical protein